jgi:RNA polymerase sigma factor for flagellar operon FliA
MMTACEDSSKENLFDASLVEEPRPEVSRDSSILEEVVEATLNPSASIGLQSQAAKELMEEAQGLVHSLASKIYRRIPVRVDYEDLVAYGEVGLAEAARDFDPRLGTRFTTFAYYRVRGAIYDGLAKMSWTNRAHHQRLRAMREYNEQNSPSTDERSKKQGPWLGQVAGKISVVYLASQEYDERTGDAVFEDPHDSVVTLVARKEISEKLHRLVSELPSVERQLIQSVYFDGSSLQQAASRLSISKSWASRLHARALEHLARALRQMGVQEMPRARLR